MKGRQIRPGMGFLYKRFNYDLIIGVERYAPDVAYVYRMEFVVHENKLQFDGTTRWRVFLDDPVYVGWTLLTC